MFTVRSATKLPEIWLAGLPRPSASPTGSVPSLPGAAAGADSASHPRQDPFHPALDVPFDHNLKQPLTPGAQPGTRSLDSARAYLQLVSDSPDRLNRWIGNAAAGKLVPELLDVHVDGAGVSGEVVTPDQIQQLAALEDPARVPGEQRQEVELLRPELH